MPQAMSDLFVPLAPAASLPRESVFAAIDTKAPADAAARPAFEHLLATSADPSRSPGNCAKPSVTLKREGDVVTGIRIQCGCGRVTDLSCIY
jgi:hypothetical protein